MTALVGAVMNGPLKTDTEERCLHLSASDNSDISRPFQKEATHTASVKILNRQVGAATNKNLPHQSVFLQTAE
jgi:hypothetical protein